jgi:hypothetical protein
MQKNPATPVFMLVYIYPSFGQTETGAEEAGEGRMAHNNGWSEWNDSIYSISAITVSSFSNLKCHQPPLNTGIFSVGPN